MPRISPVRPLAVALAMTLVSGLALAPVHAQKKKRAAAPKPPAVTPQCTDFYTFANADWLKANALLPGADSVSAMEQLVGRARQQQVDLLNGAMQSPQGNVQQLLGDFWASGLDEAAVEADGANPIAPLLTRIAGIKRTKDIPPAIAALHQVGIPVAFNFVADVDLQDLDRHVGYFSQGGMGLPDPAYYTRMDPRTRELLGRYNNYVQKMLALTGTPQAQLAAEAQLVIDLESRIAQSSASVAALREPRANYAQVATNTLDKTYKRLQLSDFLKVQGVSDDAVSMANPALFAQLDALVAGLKPAQWQTYLRYHVANAMAPYLARSFRDAHFDFHGRALKGQANPPARAAQVLSAIELAAGPMLGREYVGQFLAPATRARAEDIAKQVRAALESAASRDPRLTAEARAVAVAKARALKIEIGAPRRDLDYTVQPMGRGSFGSNMLIASTWQHREEMKRIGRGNADRRWPMSPQTPALAYDIAQNRLIVTAAMLQAPVLDLTREPAAHYGSFGALVGHELSQAIGVSGRLVDARGDLRDWWTPADATAADAFATRVASQYNAYPYPMVNAVRVNGTQTRDQNVADLLGLELAWNAFNAAYPASEKPAQQAFYTAWAQLWPQYMTIETATQRAATSVHAPGQWRANGPLVNQPGFAAAFDCKAGQPMSLATEQQVSLWR